MSHSMAFLSEYHKLRYLAISHCEIDYAMGEVEPMHQYRIRELREDRDLTQQFIASYLSVAQNTYSNYENGKREIPIVLLIRLADFYHVNMDYLIGRTDVKEMLPPTQRMKL